MDYDPPDRSSSFQLRKSRFCLGDCRQLLFLLIAVSIRKRFEIYLFGLLSPYQLRVRFHLQIANFAPHQDRPIRVGLGVESTCSRDYRTEPLSRPNAVGTRMLDLATN